MTDAPSAYVHLHMVSDATGETLIAVGRAASAQYPMLRSIDHVYPLVRSHRQLDRVLAEIEAAPGIVLYTMIDTELSDRLERKCRELGVPCVSVLEPVLRTFQSYLGLKKMPTVGAQHVLNQNYFRRIDALNFALIHDDGHLPDDISEADVVLIGISRTSKTPTSIYLANRGIKVANVPIVPDVPLPRKLETDEGPLIVALIASPDRIVQIRQNRMLALRAEDETSYTDRDAVAQEIKYTRKLCARNAWPIIDVTRRSIEETAAAVLAHYNERQFEKRQTDA